ncbi:hypothetical protein AB6809_24960 [Paraburkholderia sp. RCC_158]
MVDAFAEGRTRRAASGRTGQARDDGTCNSTADDADRTSEGPSSGTEFGAGQRCRYRTGAACRRTERATETACKVTWRCPDRVARRTGVDRFAHIGAVAWDCVLERAGRLLRKLTVVRVGRPMRATIFVVIVDWPIRWVAVRHASCRLFTGRV